MALVEFLSRYDWRSDELPVCVLDVPVAELAWRLGLPLRRWDVDGVGEAEGFVCRSPSGLVLKVEELAYARAHLGAQGPTVYTEACDLAAHGVARTLALVVGDLGLLMEDVVWS